MTPLCRLGRALAALALLALLVLPARAADAPGTIVLQLPPSMTEEQVKALIAELQGQGAKPQPPAVPAPAAGRDWNGEAERVADAWLQAVAAAPTLLEIPQRWAAARAAEGGAGVAFFWLRAGLVLLAAWLGEQAVLRLLRRWRREPIAGNNAALVKAGLAQLSRLALGLGAFAVILRLGLPRLDGGSVLLDATRNAFSQQALHWRIAVAIAAALLVVDRPALRLFRLPDDGARRAQRLIDGYFAIGTAVVLLVWLVERLGYGQRGVFAAAATFGGVVTLYKVFMFWRLRSAVATAILAADEEHPGALRQLVAATWHWFFIALALAIYLMIAIGFAGGGGAELAAAGGTIQGIVIALAMVWAIKQHLLCRFMFRPGMARRWWAVTASRAIDLAVPIVGLVGLTRALGVDIIDPAPGTLAAIVLRPILNAALTLAAGWVLVTAVASLLEERMPRVAALDDEDGPTVGAASRLGTLLPLIRNLTIIAVAFVTAMVALSYIGVDIAPLLAGAGVVGLAIGFGAQSLVRDVISGLFFLIDDAFRVGEYIDTGKLKGTVEGMSLRSVRLRHQNGQVHTIPFGQIQAVTNFSRDWAVIKFNLQLAAGADLERVRRTIKAIGQELMEDEEIGADFIQPLKMQGVVELSQGALIVRCKFTATPARPTYLQRRAMRRIIERFAELGIAFAPPTLVAPGALSPV